MCIDAIRQQASKIIIGLRPLGTQPGDFLTIQQRIEIIGIAVPDAVIVAIESAPYYDSVFTCNPDLQNFYRNQGEYVIELPRFGGSATEIRRRLAAGEDISCLVYPGTAEMIQRFWAGWLDKLNRAL